MKKIVGVLLLTLICAGIFVGCGTQNEAKYAFPSDTSVMLDAPKSEIISKFGLTDSVDTSIAAPINQYGTKDQGKVKYKIGRHEAVYAACRFSDDGSSYSFEYVISPSLKEYYVTLQDVNNVFDDLKKHLDSIYGIPEDIRDEDDSTHRLAEYTVELPSGKKYYIDLETIGHYESGSKTPSSYSIIITIYPNRGTKV